MRKSLSSLILFVIILSFSLPLLASDKATYSDLPKISKPGVFTFWVEWIKDKGDKYDYRLHLENDSSSKDLLVRVNHIECYRGGQTRKDKK